MGRERADARVLGLFYKLLVQAVLISGLDKWVVNPCIVRALGGFNNRLYHLLIGNQPQRQADGIWDEPPPWGRQ